MTTKNLFLKDVSKIVFFIMGEILIFTSVWNLWKLFKILQKIVFSFLKLVIRDKNKQKAFFFHPFFTFCTNSFAFNIFLFRHETFFAEPTIFGNFLKILRKIGLQKSSDHIECWNSYPVTVFLLKISFRSKFELYINNHTF